MKKTDGKMGPSTKPEDWNLAMSKIYRIRGGQAGIDPSLLPKRTIKVTDWVMGDLGKRCGCGWPLYPTAKGWYCTNPECVCCPTHHLVYESLVRRAEGIRRRRETRLRNKEAKMREYESGVKSADKLRARFTEEDQLGGRNW